MKSNKSEKASKPWLEGIPCCALTGAGYKMKEHYSSSLQWSDVTQGGDRTFYCRANNNTYLYAIFSGHNGNKIADFALERMAAEILLGQLDAKASEEKVKDVLRQAFYSVEKCYLESIESVLAEKMALQLEMDPNMSDSDKVQFFPHTLERIKNIDAYLTEGGSVVLALIHNSKLYISNLGNCRALLCRKDENNVLKVMQLTADHNLSNEDEILRLRQIGLSVENLKKANLHSTRCIGCYSAKEGYRQFPYLTEASSEPVISQPEIYGGQMVDESFRFLILMSAGLCKCLQEIYRSETSQDNKEITQVTVEQLRSQPTLNGVAQMVVERIVHAHREKYKKTNADGFDIQVSGHEDLTILIRNFHFTMPHAISVQKKNHVTFNPYVEQLSLPDNGKELNGAFSSISTGGDVSNISPSAKETRNAKIQAYVKFDSYYENVKRAVAKGTLPPEIDFD